MLVIGGAATSKNYMVRVPYDMLASWERYHTASANFEMWSVGLALHDSITLWVEQSESHLLVFSAAQRINPLPRMPFAARLAGFFKRLSVGYTMG